MNLIINVNEFIKDLNNIERCAILASCIDSAYRYDYDAISRKLAMAGRTIFSNRGSWSERGSVVKFILQDGQPTGVLGNNLPDMQRTLIKKRNLIEATIQTVGFDAWIQEFLKIYNITWVMNRVNEVLRVTRHSSNVLENDDIEYQLHLSLEIMQ